jgi:hypothetical protein
MWVLKKTEESNPIMRGNSQVLMNYILQKCHRTLDQHLAETLPFESLLGEVNRVLTLLFIKEQEKKQKFGIPIRETSPSIIHHDFLTK